MRVAAWYIVLMMTGMGVAQAQSSVRPSLKTSPGLQVRKLQEEDMAVYLIGDQMKTLEDGTLRLEGGAQVRRIDSVVKGDRIDYQEKTGQVEVRGNGLIMRDGAWCAARSLITTWTRIQGACRPRSSGWGPPAVAVPRRRLIFSVPTICGYPM